MGTALGQTNLPEERRETHDGGRGGPHTHS